MFQFPLSDAGYVEAFAATRGAVTNYFVPVPDYPIYTFDRPVIARLKITANTNAGAGSFSGLISSSQLTASFGNYEEGTGDTPLVAKPEDRSGLAYAKAYAIQYDPARSQAYGAENVIASVVEKNLENNTTVPANWICDTNYRFKIVRNEDRHKLIYDAAGNAVEACPFQSSVGLMSTDQQKRLRIIQRMLPASGWDINIDRNCIVPRGDKCYQDNRLVAYDDLFFTSADTTATPPKYAGCDVDQQPACPHFMSICFRNDL
jgi:hypothetical protein